MSQHSAAALYPISVGDLRDLFRRAPGAGRVGYVDESRDLSFGGETGEGALEDYSMQMIRAIRCGYLLSRRSSRKLRKRILTKRIK
ncbi:MAG: hypothetical protein KDD56_00200 [Bdellovibrionales bacterium]|nr:hypothetical protein [Bdellovibrionales bacterium]